MQNFQTETEIELKSPYYSGFKYFFILLQNLSNKENTYFLALAFIYFQ